MSVLAKKLLGVTIGAIIVVGLIGLYVGFYLTQAPSSVAAVQTASGPQLYLATVPAAEPNDPNSTWVSYYAVNPGATNWVHATTYTLPANTLVRVTIYNFDSASGLRNEFLGEATGTLGGAMLLDGKPTQAIDPATASHIFAIPEVGLSIPLQGVSATAKNPCANAPCTLQNDHTTTVFTFRTPSKGLYRWQCFVPCAAGFIQGFGGPMQTVGYMDGFIRIV